MRRVLLAVPLALLAAGCGGGPDLAACESAVRALTKEGFSEALAGRTPDEASKPEECDGVSDADLERIGREVLGDELGSIFDG